MEKQKASRIIAKEKVSPCELCPADYTPFSVEGRLNLLPEYLPFIKITVIIKSLCLELAASSLCSLNPEPDTRMTMRQLPLLPLNPSHTRVDLGG